MDETNVKKPLIEYPAVIDFRIIVTSDERRALDKIQEVADSISKGSMEPVFTSPRQSSNGKYLSYTVPIKVGSEAMLKEMYQKIGAIECVKHIL